MTSRKTQSRNRVAANGDRGETQHRGRPLARRPKTQFQPNPNGKSQSIKDFHCVQSSKPSTMPRLAKSRSAMATVTETTNEILYSLNKPKDFILAIVEFLDSDQHRVHYLRRPFRREPDFGVTSVNYDFAELLEKAEAPR